MRRDPEWLSTAVRLVGNSAGRESGGEGSIPSTARPAWWLCIDPALVKGRGVWGFNSPSGHVKTYIVDTPMKRCPHCGEGIDVSQFGRGDEKAQSQTERRKQQSKDRMEDVNQSTRPGQVNMADLQARR